jgi:peptide/nickel transport system permease protein
MRRAGWLLAASIVLAAAAAPWLAVHGEGDQHRDFVHAPPMRPRIAGPDGRWQRPFVYPLRLVDRLSRTYEEDRARPVSLVWLSGGVLVSADPGAGVAWFPLGTDALGRDVWSRLVLGSRVSLGLAALACLGALAIGALIGGVAGLAGGVADEILMRLAEVVVVVPLLYVVLALRAAMPLVLPPATLFAILAVVLALAGWPTVARGVRAIVASEAARDYASAARAAGAGPVRVLARHLLPATLPFLGTQALLLAPAFILAEATLSYVGLGFLSPMSSWGTLLQDAANVRAIAEFPWALSPAIAISLTVLALNMVIEERAG